jgi:hypothetical protein
MSESLREPQHRLPKINAKTPLIMPAVAKHPTEPSMEGVVAAADPVGELEWGQEEVERTRHNVEVRQPWLWDRHRNPDRSPQFSLQGGEGGSSDRLCRHSHLRRDQGDDRGGNGFPLLQADCGCEVAGCAPAAAKAPCSETTSTMFNSSAAPISDRPVPRRWTSAIALTLATFDRCSCSGETWSRLPTGGTQDSLSRCGDSSDHGPEDW